MILAKADFELLDWVVLISYFVGITAFGLWVARKIRTSAGYFLGERRFKWWIMLGQSFSTGTNAENPVAQTGATFRGGFATIWYQWKNMLITPFYWLMAPWYRRSERTTVGEIIEDRYCRWLGLLYTVFAIAFFVFNQGAMLKGAGKVIAIATGGQVISPNGVVALMSITFILFSFFGGLRACAYTDFVQGFLIIVLSFMLIPFGLAAVGGFSGMRETLATPNVRAYAQRASQQADRQIQEERAKLAALSARSAAAGGTDPRLQSELADQEAQVRQMEAHPAVVPGEGKGTGGFFEIYNENSGIDAFTLLMLTLNGFVGITAMPHILTMNASGNNERSGRIGQTYGSFTKRFCTIGWALTGLIVAAVVIKDGAFLRDPEETFGYASRELLCPGLTGLLVACILAANVSTCSTFMVNAGALFTRNIYREYVNRTPSDRQLLIMGRLSGLGLTGLGILFALYVQNILDAFMFTETIAAYMGIMFLGGLLWKRANRWGALAGVSLAYLTAYALNYLMSCRPAGGSGHYATLAHAWGDLTAAVSDGTAWTFLAGGQLKLVYRWTAGPFGWAMLAGFAAFVIVSLLTRREDPQQIERFFDNQRRTTDEESLPEGQLKPLASERGQELILLDAPGWFTRRRWQGFFRRYREDVVGFALAWVAVGALLAIAWAVMQIGK